MDRYKIQYSPLYGNREKPGTPPTEVSGSAKVVVRALPEAYALHPSVPNPFNPFTILPYALPRNSAVRLTVYDLRGSVVRVLVDRLKEAGHYREGWDGRDAQGNEVSSGVYVVRLEVREGFRDIVFSQAQRITLIR